MSSAALFEFVAESRAAAGMTWSNASRVSLSRKYVCVSVPKVGCSTLKLAVHTLEAPANKIEWWQTHDDWPGWCALDHPDDVVVEMLSSPDWFRFCFVRNPYDRLVSAWKSKLATDDDRHYGWLRDGIRQAFDYPMLDGDQPALIDFRDSFDYITTTDLVTLRDPHWMPQYALLRPDVISYDVVGRFETFASDFHSIFSRLDAPSNVLAMAQTRYNATFDTDLHNFYDADLAGRVYDVYAEDFRSFGYAPDSWRLPLGSSA